MPRVRLPSGEVRDEIRQVLWDTIDIAAAEAVQATRSFFSNVQGKLKSQTNLRQNNLLEAAVSFRTMGLVLDAQNTDATQLTVLPLLMDHSYVEFVVGEKIYWQGNGEFATGRLFQTTTADAYQRYGDVAVQSVGFTGIHVVDIPPLQSFRVNWTVEGMASPPTVASALRFIMSLKGLMRRPVQ